MNEFSESIDLSLRAEFIDEALDGLDSVSELFVELENDPDDPKIIQSIFRPVHSIKGNAAYFGMLSCKTLAHEMESILDRIRKGGLTPVPHIIDGLLKGTDELAAILKRVRDGGEEIEDADGFEALLADVRDLTLEEKETEEGLWRILLDRLSESADLLSVLQDAHKLANYYTSGRAAMGLRAETKGSGELPEPARKIEALFKDEETEPDPEEVRHLIQECMEIYTDDVSAVDLKEALSEVELLAGTIGLGDAVSRECFLDHMDKLKKTAAPQALSVEKQVSERPEKVSGETVKTDNGRDKAAKTMRIPEESIDAFLSFVGELVTVGEMYSFLQTNLGNGMEHMTATMELRRINESFAVLSRALQDSIMNIRKVPMQIVMQKVPRLVRDVASVSGKNIQVIVEGEKILADKSIVDNLEAPIVHMVRNAADHGIEDPDTRRNTGKPEQGLIRVTATEGADDLIITVSDDGRGLDREALAQKAREIGLIRADSRLTDDDIIDLLFRSGVSTAREVTDISGRGVGMDVVKKAIESLNGQISVKSTQGQGSTFTVRLPKSVSTQIFNGFIIVSEHNSYILPLERVVRAFRPDKGDVVSVKGQGKCVQTETGFAPVIRLRDCFGSLRRHREDEDYSDGVLVLVESRDGLKAIHTDGLVGVRQVVLKQIDGLNSKNDFFQGGAIMGDGSVAMIIDVDRLASVRIYA